MERYVCIHGHFYQPPRENPWLEAIELQDGAYPYHDWNQRITAECYAPNSAARILGKKGQITQIVNNYAKISFNFGPTLLSWMEINAPEVYRAILESDRQSQQNFSGHGSAMAQCYNHLIMPLANHRDKYTQVLWGIRDFKKRFGRKPRGMWLPETAVDLETLDIMAELGLAFTILAPHQARRVRTIGTEEWETINNGEIDTTMPYRLPLPSGRSIIIFFYSDPLARGVAFEGLLTDGQRFAQRLLAGPEPTQPTLVHIATDGETYGHHHRYGEMALAYALHYIESNDLARITNYSQYLEQHPPTREVEIVENTSWSCAHGVERWRSDCGDNAGRHPGFNQAWRAPLREALDWLRDTLAPQFEEKASVLLKDPWAARNDYIEVVLDRSPQTVEKFLARHALHPLGRDEQTTALKLLELERHAMLMYTSCGWFFDEISDIETVQVIQYAGRAIQLGQELFGDGIESKFLGLLEQAKSNIPEQGDGRRIYEKYVRPSKINLKVVGAHFAISSLFEEYSEHAEIYCYRVDLQDYRSFVAGKPKLALGVAKVTAQTTGESALLAFGVLHFGDHNMSAGVGEYRGHEAYQAMVDEISDAFSTVDLPGVIRLLDRHFGTPTYSLRSLFRDEQRKIMSDILASIWPEIETAYRQIYERHYPLLRFLTELDMPLPKPFRAATEIMLNNNLRQALGSTPLETEHAAGLLNEAKMWKIDLDAEGLGYLLQQTLKETMARLVSTPDDLALLKSLVNTVTLVRSLPFEVNLWQVQNLYYQMLRTIYPGFQKKSRGSPAERDWVTQFISLGEQLSIEVPRAF